MRISRSAGLNAARQSREPEPGRRCRRKVLRISVGDGATLDERLRGSGLPVRQQGGTVQVIGVRFGSDPAKFELSAGDKIKTIYASAEPVLDDAALTCSLIRENWHFALAQDAFRKFALELSAEFEAAT